MTFDSTKHDIEQFTYDLKILVKMSMVDDQILQHFKKAFIDIDKAISKARVLILLFKSELPQAISSLVIVYVTNITDHAAYNGEKSKHSRYF